MLACRSPALRTLTSALVSCMSVGMPMQSSSLWLHAGHWQGPHTARAGQPAGCQQPPRAAARGEAAHDVVRLFTFSLLKHPSAGCS